jgi:hypothetical protein
MGNTPSQGTPDRQQASDLEDGRQRPGPLIETEVDAELQSPDDAFVRIGLGSPVRSSHNEPVEKKRGTLGSSLKRLLSGKSRGSRKEASPLPCTAPERCPPRDPPASVDSPRSRRKPAPSDSVASRSGLATVRLGASPFSVKKAWVGGEESSATDPAAAAAATAMEAEEEDARLQSPETLQMARYLGMDPMADVDVLWIAAEALAAPLPAGWEEHRTEEGDVYYFDTTTKVLPHTCAAFVMTRFFTPPSLTEYATAFTPRCAGVELGSPPRWLLPLPPPEAPQAPPGAGPGGLSVPHRRQPAPWRPTRRRAAGGRAGADAGRMRPPFAPPSYRHTPLHSICRAAGSWA